MGKSACGTVKAAGKIKKVSRKIQTNLYELVGTVMDEAGSADSRIVTPVVLRMLGKAKGRPAATNHASH